MSPPAGTGSGAASIRQLRRRTARGGAVAGSWARIARLRALHPGLSIGFDSFVGPGCEIRCPEGARIRVTRTIIGRGVLLDVAAGGLLDFQGGNYVGPHSVLVARERIVFRPAAQVAEMTVIRDQDHVVGDGLRLTDLLWVAAAVELGPRVQVCAKATVLKGVRIGADAVVAAGAVVTRDVPAATLVGGVPARILRSLASDRARVDRPLASVPDAHRATRP